MITNDRTIVRNDDWLTAWVGDNLMMMNAQSGFYLNLTGTGGRIWELLEAPCTLTGLCEVLATEYDIEPAGVQGEVIGFIEEMERHHAVELRPSAVA